MRVSARACVYVHLRIYYVSFGMNMDFYHKGDILGKKTLEICTSIYFIVKVFEFI